MATVAERDRYAEANQEITDHIGEKIMDFIHTPENQARIQSVLDPIISHIINRVFPYIILSSILFLILLLLTAGTFWLNIRSVAFTANTIASTLVE